MLVELLFILLVVGWTVLICQRNPAITGVMLAALVVRLGLLAFHHNIFKLFSGRGDAYRFFRTAAEFSELGTVGALATFDPSTSFGYASILGSLFAVTGASWLVGELVNIFISMVVVLLTMKLAAACGADRRNTLLAGYVVALNPFVAQYGVVVLREMAVVLPMMLGVLALVRRPNPHTLVGMALCGLGIVGAALFHGSMIVGLPGIVFGLYLAQQGIGGKTRVKTSKRAQQFVVLLAGLAILALATPYLTESELSKVGGLSEGSLVDQVNEQVQGAARGGSAYLSNYSASGPVELLLTAPLRVVYFMFSPLPWDVRSLEHLLGLLDAAVYFWIALLILKAFRNKAFNEKSQAVFGILMVFIVAYSFGTSNAGTAIRHRAKFNYALVAVACALRYRLEEQKQMQRRQLAARRPALGAFATDSRT